MPTLKELQKYVRDHKRENCPPYSKLNKADILKLAQRMGYRENILSYEDLWSKKIRPLINKGLRTSDPDETNRIQIQIYRIVDADVERSIHRRTSHSALFKRYQRRIKKLAKR